MAQRPQPTVRAHLRDKQAEFEQQAKNEQSQLDLTSEYNKQGNTYKALKMDANKNRRHAQAAQIMAGDTVHLSQMPLAPRGSNGSKKKSRSKSKG